MRYSIMSIAVGMVTVSLAAMLQAEVPPDLADAVRFQQKNKVALIQKLQQRADGLRRQGNATGAKDATETIKSVRANKMLVLPKLGEELGNIGTIKIEEVLEQADGGTWIQTSLPQWENVGINARTGFTGRSPANKAFVYYPEKLLVLGMTNRDLASGVTINVRRCEGGVSEIPSSEIEAAVTMLKKK